MALTRVRGSVSEKERAPDGQEQRDEGNNTEDYADCEPITGDAISQDDESADHHGNATRKDPQYGRTLGIERPEPEWKPSPFDSNHKSDNVAQGWEEHERPNRAVFASHCERMTDHALSIG
jgi:hypothetical protein